MARAFDHLADLFNLQRIIGRVIGLRVGRLVAVIGTGFLACGVGVGVGGLSGCSTVAYYGQALGGQIEMARRQKPISEILEGGGIDPRRGEKLKRVLELRTFAATELSLPSGRNYRSFADLGREHVLWSVFAAPEFSLEPKTWFYPVVGSLEYRGFFRKKDADRCAARLRSNGFDVFVAGVDAYSTLGWFADPVLNTFIEYEDAELAELIFHELTHRRVYRSGETAFNEALATAVGQEGVLRWLQKRGDGDALRAYQSRLLRAARLYQEIADTRRELEQLFAQTVSPQEMRARKKVLLHELQDRLEDLFAGWGGRVQESWLQNLPNNARLNATATYYEHVPALRSYLKDECGGDLERFLLDMKRVDVPCFLGTD